jgi:hypothetical protein
LINSIIPSKKLHIHVKIKLYRSTLFLNKWTLEKINPQVIQSSNLSSTHMCRLDWNNYGIFVVWEQGVYLSHDEFWDVLQLNECLQCHVMLNSDLHSNLGRNHNGQKIHTFQLSFLFRWKQTTISFKALIGQICDHFTHVFQFAGEKALNQALHLVLCINKTCSLEKSDHQLLEDIPKVTQHTSNLQQGNLLSLNFYNVICIWSQWCMISLEFK